MKTLVLFHRPGSLFDIKHETFDDNEAMQAFIERKSSIGITCHQYNYVATYKTEKTIIKTELTQ